MADTPECTRPGLVDEACTLVSNEQVGPGLWVMELESPQVSREIQPGQFIHLKIPGMDGHILRRPFSVYGCDRETRTMRILYQVVGKGSAHLATLEPRFEPRLSAIGPIGNRWQAHGASRVLFVVGGVGAAPLAMFGEELVAAGVELDVCMGAQTREGLVLRSYYREVVGVDPLCSTDDGSFGHEGFVTQPAAGLMSRNRYDLVCCCGPEPLMRTVAHMAAEADAACQVSLEKRMACGVGACLSCVVDTVDGRKRSCVDGPVFDARKVVW